MQDTDQDESERERQLDAIIAEYYRSAENGKAPDQDHFIAQYSNFQQELSEFFADLGMFRQSGRSYSEENSDEPTVTTGKAQHSKPMAGTVVRYFGAYEILEELGSGGMGVVYKARHVRLRKLVALKMIRSGELATENVVKMFQAEARAAAKLDHPGIVSVHEVGIQAGQHFYSMDYVAGGSLSKLHRDEPVAVRRAAELVRQMAEATHYAHSEGIVHRDLKPANVLLTATGLPRITDFGLAKRMWPDEDSVALNLTHTGQILGTAGYMSPEQAEGKSKLVGPSADIYALGAVLYALVTTRAPFVGESQADTIKQVIEKEPVSPRVLNPSLPRDLETICLKCLSKERHERYGTAMLLAEDLYAFLAGHPIAARPIGYIGRTAKWVRRHRAVSSLLLLTFVSISTGTALSIYFAVQSQRQTIETLTAKGKIELAKRETDELLTKTNLLFEESQGQLYVLSLEAALREWKSGSAKNARLRLAESPKALRGWEYGTLTRLFQANSTNLGRGAAPLSIAVSPNGRWVATGHSHVSYILGKESRESLTIRDANDGTILHSVRVDGGNINAVAFSPDSTKIAVGGNGPIRLLDVQTGLPCGVLYGHKKSVMSLEYSADGSVITSGGLDGQLKLWDVALQKELKTLTTEGDGIRAIKTSPDGTLVASAGRKLQLWDRESGECLHTQENFSSDLAFLSDRELVTSHYDGTIRLWDLKTRECRQVFYGHTDSVTGLAVTSVPHRIVSAGADGTLRLWNPETRLPERVLSHTDKMVSCIATAPGGEWLVIGSPDGTLLRFDTCESRQPLIIKLPSRKTSDSLFSLDGRRIIAGTIDGKVVSWDSDNGIQLQTIDVSDSFVICVQMNAAETLLAVASKDKTVRILDSSSGELVRSLDGLSMASGCLAFSPTVPVIAVGDYKNIHLWNYETDKVIGQWEAHEFTVENLKFSPDGDRLYSTSISGSHGVKVWDIGTQSEILNPGGRRHGSSILGLTKNGRILLTSGPSLWDTQSGETYRKLPAHRGSATISPDGKRIAAIEFPDIRLIDVESGREMAALNMSPQAGEPSVGWGINFSPDGTRLLVERSDSIMVWDGSPLPEEIESKPDSILTDRPDVGMTTSFNVATESATETDDNYPRMVLNGHVNDVNSVAFSADGTQLATASSDETVRIWNSGNGQQQLVLEGPEYKVNDVAFSPDGRQLAAAYDNGTIVVWDPIKGQARLTLKGHVGPVNRIAFSPNGLSVTSCGRDGTIRIWEAESGQQSFSLSGNLKSVTCIALSPDGQQLIFGGGDGAVKLWDIQTQSERRSLNLHRYAVFCVAFSPDGKRCISSSDDKTVSVFDAANGIEFYRIGTRALAIKYSPDGRFIATAGAGSPPQLWDSKSGSKVLSLKGSAVPYVCTVFSSDGKRLAAASDKTVDVWQLPDSIIHPKGPSGK